MLDELSIVNLGVIGSAQISPGPGMVVLSGETGTGKTMLLGALRLLAGDASSADLVGPHGTETAVEGRFLFEDGEMVVSRKIVSEGRSRAYIDGEMVSVKKLSKKMAGRIEIVGRQDRMGLTSQKELRDLLDRCVPSAELSAAYQTAWEKRKDLAAARKQLGGDRRGLEREQEMLAYQVKEIAAGGFVEGEDVLLHGLRARLQSAQELQEILHQVRGSLDQARDYIGEAVGRLRQGATLDKGLSSLLTQIESIEVNVIDSLEVARQSGEGIEENPEKLEEVGARLRLLGDLRRKYGETITEIIQFYDQAILRSREITEIVENAETIDAQISGAEKELETAGRELRQARHRAAQQVDKIALQHLREMGFAQPSLQIEVKEAIPGPGGADQIEILFSSHPQLAPAPVKRVASGGELSRLILSLRLASGAGSARIVAFDEIDAGMGGAVALAMGSKLAELATHRQVFCVSHLPQVAAFADSHLVVERDGAKTEVSKVEGDRRRQELTRMLSGLSDSAPGLQHAEELLTIAQGRRVRPPNKNEASNFAV